MVVVVSSSSHNSACVNKLSANKLLLWSSCFFCYKKRSGARGEGEGEEEEERSWEMGEELARRFLTMFQRHLGIGEEEEEGIREGLFCGDGEDRNLLLPCEDCFQLLDSFCGLYGEWKRLEMRLDWKVGKLEGIMRAADGVPGRVQHFLEVVSRFIPGVGSDGRLEDQGKYLKEVIGTRKRLLEKCKRRLDKSFPRVALKRCAPGGTQKIPEATSSLQPETINLEASLPPPPPSTTSILLTEEEKREYYVKARRRVTRSSPNKSGAFPDAAGGSPPPVKILRVASLAQANNIPVGDKPVSKNNNNSQQPAANISKTVSDIPAMQLRHIFEGPGPAPATSKTITTMTTTTTTTTCNNNSTRLEMGTSRSTEPITIDDTDSENDKDDDDNNVDDILEITIEDDPEECNSETRNDVVVEEPTTNENVEDAPPDTYSSTSTSARTAVSVANPPERVPTVPGVPSIDSAQRHRPTRFRRKMTNLSTDQIGSDCEGGGAVEEECNSSGDEFDPSSIMETGNDSDSTNDDDDDDAEEVTLIPEPEIRPPNPIKTKTCETKTKSSRNPTITNLEGKQPKPNTKYFYYTCNLCKTGDEDEIPQRRRQRQQRYQSLKKIRQHLKSSSDHHGHGLSPTEIKATTPRPYTKRPMSKADIRDLQDLQLLDLYCTPSAISPSKALSDYKLFPCIKSSSCPAKFHHLTPLRNHLKYHARFSCHDCGGIRRSAIDIALHELTHHDGGNADSKSGGKAYKYKCRRCEDWSSNSKSDYLRHHLGDHLELPTVTGMCPICEHSGSGFDEKFEAGLKYIRKHMKECHDTSEMSPTEVPKCDQCPAYFKTEQQLEVHKSNSHSDPTSTTTTTPTPPRHECADCKKVFKNGEKLRRHRYDTHVKHPEDRPFVCSMEEDCSKRFESLVDLENHQRVMHNNDKNPRVLCPTCGKLFHKTTIASHMTSHRDNKEPKSAVVCDQCGRSFRHNSVLRKHQLSHSGPASWSHSCPSCGKRCLNPSKLREHLRTHSPQSNKPFVCEVCGVAYAHRHNLRLHLNSKHNNSGRDGGQGEGSGGGEEEADIISSSKAGVRVEEPVFDASVVKLDK